MGGYEKRVGAMTVWIPLVMVQENQLMGNLPDRWAQLQEHEADVDVPAVNYVRM